MRLIRNILMAIALPTLATGPLGAAPEPVTRARYLMGTICEARAFGDPADVGPALDAALDRIAELENAMTTWREDGGLARLNAACASAEPGLPHPVDPDLANSLADSLAWAVATGGAFDPTVEPLVVAWGLRDGGRVPDDRALAEARHLTSWRLVEVDRDAATVRCARRGVALGLGGFGKGWALDEAARILRERGVDAALINFGGQVLALGAPPGRPGWIVDIADPVDRDRAVASLWIRDAGVATSGNAERSFVVEGRRYGHLLDPRTGRPVDHVGSATIVHPIGAAADALATALAVGGPDAVAAVLPDGTEYLWLEPAVDGSLSAVATPGMLRRAVDGAELSHLIDAARRGATETER